MKVGILGSGLMGAKLGTLFSRAGHDVTFSYSRDPKKLEKLAREAGGKARAGTPREAADKADAVLVAVNWWNLDDLLSQSGSLAGKVVISCSMPMNEDNSGLVIAHTSSGAEALQKKLPKAHVVQAFNTVPSEVLFDVFEARRNKNRPSLLHCGDDAKAKETAAALIRDVGFDPIDAGALKLARYMEPFVMLIAELAYNGDGGPELTYRIERF